MPRAVVIVRGGLITEVLVDDKSVDVLILDQDCEGCDNKYIKSFQDENGEDFKAASSYNEVTIINKEQVDKYFKVIGE